MQKHGYMTNVVNKHLTNLKALINAAFTDGVHDNQRAASLIVREEKRLRIGKRLLKSI